MEGGDDPLSIVFTAGEGDRPNLSSLTDPYPPDISYLRVLIPYLSRGRRK